MCVSLQSSCRVSSSTAIWKLPIHMHESSSLSSLFPFLFLQLTLCCGTGGPRWWDLLEATALTMPSGARPLNLSASSKACKCLCVHMCVTAPINQKTWSAPLNQSHLPLIHLSSLLLLPYFPHSIIYLLLRSHFHAFLLFSPCVSCSASACCHHFMSYFQTTYCFSSLFSHILIPSTHVPPLFTLLQSNSPSVMAEERWWIVWVSDH